MNFEEANKKVHKVEDQWHFPILTAYEFQSATPESTGLVRRYKYTGPNGVIVTCVTGASSDYWESSDGKRGYWSALEPYLKTL